VVWQKGLVEREINELLRGLVRDDDERNKSNHNHTTKVKKKKILRRFFHSCLIVWKSILKGWKKKKLSYLLT
jgi:hypothetical protein